MITATLPPMPATNRFSINEFFNGLPLRIIGSHQEPFFYACDIATILGIERPRSVIIGKKSAFTEKDIVTQGQRKQYDLVTYRLHKGKWHIDNRVILLTERGVYKFINNSKSALVSKFQDFIYDTIHEARMNDPRLLNVIQQSNMDALTESNRKLNVEVQTYRNKIPMMYIFRKNIGNDSPYEHILTSEVDEEILDMDRRNPPSRDSDIDEDNIVYLYKITKSPSTEDYNSYTLYARVYGSSIKIFNCIEDPLATTEKAAKYCYYTVEQGDIDNLLDEESITVEEV